MRRLSQNPLPWPLLICLALAGCAGANAAFDATPETTGAAPQRGGHAAAKQDEWWKEGGVTREKISAMCWMKYEKGRADLPLEKRADLVNDCIEQAAKQYRVR